MGVKMSEMTADVSVAGTEKLLALDGSTSKTMTTAVLGAYVIDVLGAATSVAPASGDLLSGFRVADERRFTLNAVSTYAVDYVWANVTTNASPVGSDMLLTNRTDVVYETSLDSLKTYILTGAQATVLNTSALGPATLGATDLVTVCQVGDPTVPKTVALSALETKLWIDYATYLTGLGAVTVPADANLLYCTQGGTPKSLTLTLLASYMSDEIISHGDIQSAVLDTLDTYTAALAAVSAPADTDLLYCTQSGTAKKLDLLTLANYAVANALELPWKEISSSKWPDATPASTSTLVMNDTSDLAIGLPVKYVYGGVSYYGIVSALSAGALLTVAGAPFNTLVDLTALYVGLPSGVTQMDFVVDTAYGDAAQDIFSAVTYERHRWQGPPAYLVQFSATHGVADTGAAQPKLNVKAGGNLVSTNDTNKGLQLSATPGTWVDSSAIAIDTTNYAVVRGEEIDLRCTVAGTNGDANVLSVSCTFVHA